MWSSTEESINLFAQKKYSNFVLTETTKTNLDKILQSQVNPILLEGGTGVGKSATIQIAADLSQKKLVRFNMSSKINIDDLLGKVMFSKDAATNRDVIQFQLRPFSQAFKEGFWLLLDEMNLAPDSVLQCIEHALDTQILTLNDPCNATESQISIPMHHDFRLFGTQNPNTGFFKGKREKLSLSLLDRFTVYFFDEFSDHEWTEIIKEKLLEKFGLEEANELSEFMVKKVHRQIKTAMCKGDFDEVCSYSAISMRELLRWCEILLVHHLNLNGCNLTRYPIYFFDIKFILFIMVTKIFVLVLKVLRFGIFLKKCFFW